MSESNNPNEMKTEDELIEEAMAALDQPLPDNTMDQLAVEEPSGEETEEMMGGDLSPSPTLAALDDTRRPKAVTVCERCPNSVWFASPEEVKCYCRVMYLVTWSSKEPNQILLCDGEHLGGD